MQRVVKYAIMAVIAISICVSLYSVTYNQGLWWDEAVYIGLSRGLTQGHYSLESGTSIETFRPPMLPFLLMPIHGSMELIRILMVIISIISVISVYFLAKEIFSKDVGFFAALLLAGNNLFIFFNNKILSEPLFIAFFSLSLLFFFKWKRSSKYKFLVLAGIFSGLTFLTRYFGSLLILAYVIYFAYHLIRKDRVNNLKYLVILLISIAVVLSPWMINNYNHYGDPIGGFTENYRVYSDSNRQNLLQGVSDIFSGWGLSTLLIVGLICLFKERKLNKHLSIIILLLILTVASYLILPHKEVRYLLSFSPIYLTLAAFGIVKLSSTLDKKAKTKYAGLVFAAIILILALWVVISSSNMLWEDRLAANALVQSSKDLQTLTKTTDSVMSTSYPYIYALAQRKAVYFPQNQEEILPTIQKNNVSYIVVYKFEPTYPDYVVGYFNSSQDFEKAKTYFQWGDPEAVVIYKVNQT